MPDPLTSHATLLSLETHTLPLSSLAHTTCAPRYSSGLRAYGLLPVAASGPTTQAQQEKGKPSQPPSSPAAHRTSKQRGQRGWHDSRVPSYPTRGRRSDGAGRSCRLSHGSCDPRHRLTPRWHLQLSNQNVFSEIWTRILQAPQCRAIGQESFQNLNNYIFLSLGFYHIVLIKH